MTICCIKAPKALSVFLKLFVKKQPSETYEN